jgi:hypothetical protein
VSWQPLFDENGADMLSGCRAACAKYLQSHGLPSLISDGTFLEDFPDGSVPWVRADLHGQSSAQPREYKCGVIGCEHRSAKLSNVIRHSWAKHRSQRIHVPKIECSLCSNSFTRPDHRVRHSKNFHIVKDFDEMTWRKYGEENEINMESSE